MVIGRYPSLQVLGEGGMGTVYLAQHPELGHYLVIKSLRAEYTQNEAILRRFYAEAQVLAGLSHPAIVRLYDFFTENNIPYIVLEYVNGETLDSYLRRNSTLDPATTHKILEPVFSALAYLHSQKIIHRDIKPSNIMVLPEGGSKLIDFGIAKKLDIDLHLTQAGTQVGTVLYMAPEQIKGAEVTHHADLYAMGLVVYECLFGQYPWPWENKTQFQIYQMLLTEPPPIPAWAPTSWQAFFAKALAKEPLERFRSAEEMAKALQNLTLSKETSHPQKAFAEASLPEAVAQPQTANLSLEPLADSKRAVSPATPPSPNQPLTKPKSTNKVLFIVIGAAFLISALIGYSLNQKRQKEEQLAATIENALVAWFNSQKAALENQIRYQIRQATNDKIAPEVHLRLPSSLKISRDMVHRFEQRNYLTETRLIEVSLVWTPYHYTSEDAQEECQYRCGFLGLSLCYGTRQIRKYYAIPYRCEMQTTASLQWTVDESLKVQGTLENLESLVSEARGWLEKHPSNENNCLESGKKQLYREEPLTDCY